MDRWRSRGLAAASESLVTRGLALALARGACTGRAGDYDDETAVCRGDCAGVAASDFGGVLRAPGEAVFAGDDAEAAGGAEKPNALAVGLGVAEPIPRAVHL